MPVTPYTAALFADAFIRKHDLVDCKGDLMLLAKQLTDNPEANEAVGLEWLSTREHVKKSVEAKNDEAIDITLERKAFGAAASPSGRAALFRHYGEALFEQRRQAWGASPGTIQSGSEPGADSLNAETVANAKMIVADQDSNSPYNPAKRYLNDETRANECAKFLARFGTKAVRAQCEKFSVDIAGRPLRKRA